MPPPPPKEKFFLLRLCFIDEASGEYTGREVWRKLHRGGGGGGIHQVGGYKAPQSVCDATATWVQSYAPKGGSPTKHMKRGLSWWSLSRMPPPPLRVRLPPPPPSRRRWTRWRPNPPPPPKALDVGALAASVATHVTDTCKTLVDQAAATGVEAALAKGRAADQKSALSKA